MDDRLAFTIVDRDDMRELSRLDIFDIDPD